jgi:hypothetical protein
MKPTPKLRFVTRKGTPDPFYINAMTGKPSAPTYRVLQQWWDFETFAGEGEWRDVSLEKEND